MLDCNDAFKGISRKCSKDIDMTSLNRDINWKKKSAKKHKELALSYSRKESRERCPICNEIEHGRFVTIYNYDYLQCSKCGHIYLKDLIDENEIKELYLGQENKNLQHMVYLSEELFDKRVKQIAYPKVQWVSNSINKKGIWIDIGCGTGEILSVAKSFGYEVIGIDSDEKEIEFAKSKGIDVICDYVNESNAHKYLENGSIISLFNILEHLDDPAILLKNIANNVHDGTYVIVEVPRHPSISSLSNLVFNDMACRHIYPPDHIHIFTEKSMEIMIRDAGLKPISIWTFGQDAYEYLMTSLADKKIEKNEFIDYIIKSIPMLQKSIDESGLSDTMIVICKK